MPERYPGPLRMLATIERVVTDWPKMERIDTYNAMSNQPMLDINVAMGHKPIQITNAYQGDTAST